MAARERFVQEAGQLRPEDVVFVDESGIATNMARRYGRAPVGQRAVGRVPAGHWRQLTVLGGLSAQGLQACMSIEAATDAAVFLAFVREVLCPTLRPGQTVVLDNLSAHKAEAVRLEIEAADCKLLFLPPYSPEFNPIELAWSKLKALLRAEAARTKEALEAALAKSLDAISETDARAWFAHCGYPPRSIPT